MTVPRKYDHSRRLSDRRRALGDSSDGILTCTRHLDPCSAPPKFLVVSVSPCLKFKTLHCCYGEIFDKRCKEWIRGVQILDITDPDSVITSRFVKESYPDPKSSALSEIRILSRS